MTVQARIAEFLGVLPGLIARLGRSAPYRYKVFQVPKRSGAGHRTIAQPAREIKAIQSWIVKNEWLKLPVHEVATAYRPGASIKENAGRHLHNRYLLKLDFSNFFPSITESDITSHVTKHLPEKYSEEELAFLCRMVLWYPKIQPSDKKARHQLELCIGAPSSPFLSNTLMYDFDEAVWTQAMARDVAYSRYADDVALSTSKPHVLDEFIGIISYLLNDLEYPRLRLNEGKTVATSKKHLRRVTGLVLANQGYLSLGRARKRLIRSKVHHFILGNLDEVEQQSLKGMLAFAQDVEPTFVERLKQKYGNEALSQVQNLNGNRDGP